MNIQEQTEFLGFDKLNALDTLAIYLPTFQITGSISLFEYGVCKRKISDIDIVVNSFDCITYLENFFNVEYTFDYTDEIETKQDFHPVKLDGHLKYLVPNRAKTLINGVNICIFVGKNQECKFFEYMNERKFKVSHPRYAIEAKRRYLLDLEEIEKKDTLNDFQSKKRAKHLADILAYERMPSLVS
jgi:hypothetical protein